MKRQLVLLGAAAAAAVFLTACGHSHSTPIGMSSSSSSSGGSSSSSSSSSGGSSSSSSSSSSGGSSSGGQSLTTAEVLQIAKMPSEIASPMPVEGDTFSDTSDATTPIAVE